MTDRISTFTVVLENDMRDDDAAFIADAIRQLRGVISVTGKVSNVDTYMAQCRATRELREKLWKILQDEE